MGNITITEVIKDIAVNKFLFTIFLICIYILVYRILLMFIGIGIRINKKLAASKNSRKKNTLYILFKNAIKYIIIAIAFITILNNYGVNTEKIIAGLGIAGLVVGLAFQDVLKDFMAGIFIIIDEYYAVGDTIEVNGYKGEVLSLGLKTTKIKTANGEVCSMVNRNIMEVVNFSTQTSLAIVDITVAYNENEERVSKTIEKILPELEKIADVNGKVEFLGIDNFTELGMTFRITAESKPLKQLIVKREILKQLKTAFDKADIKLANLGVENYKRERVSVKK